GQACEFDYSGTQAVKALKDDGFEVVLVNSNPATIMTDPGLANATYIEPITVETVTSIIEKERPDALLPTMGGQTALNVSLELAAAGVLEKYDVELIGAKVPAIKMAEDRELFKAAMERIGLKVPESGVAKSIDEAEVVRSRMDFPVILRPSFTLGGTGGGIAYNEEEFSRMIKSGIDASPTGEILIEESVIGWKEFELEVMRDTADNVVIICSIENLDPMGVHTGDSITVAPAQTLTDKEYQLMRDASIKIIREIGVETGGSNIQFSMNPANGHIYVIEMNPRVSRSSALASKATGFPIAKIAALLSVGYTLDEIPNDITKETPASFEPMIDYVVVKVPRFTFEKFPDADPVLTTQMKSVGEVMAIGRTFKESLGKALRSLEVDTCGLRKIVRPLREGFSFEPTEEEREVIIRHIKIPSTDRLHYVAEAIRAGLSTAEIYSVTSIDPWFINNMMDILLVEEELYLNSAALSEDILRRAKEAGLSNKWIAAATGRTAREISATLSAFSIVPVYKRVDTCAAEFEAHTPYLYSTYERPFYKLGEKSPPAPECEARPTDKKKVLILGSGPNRIGQGIEFDYCCVHASFALKEEGYEAIMVNCNPETVSTDYDTSDRLYFEPLTFEDVMEIVRKEEPYGVIVQLGGQTPLKLAVALEDAGVRVLGTPSDSIDRAEDRERFDELLTKLDLKRPDSGTARSIDEAVTVAGRVGYPVMVRPSYVLGGRAMEIVYDESSLLGYMTRAVEASPEHPVLIDSFLQGAIEVDCDCLSDGTEVVIGGVMEHIEEAGVHSGDSACSIPPYSLSEKVLAEIRLQAVALARELNVVGLMNVQFAVKDEEVYLIEVNPRASRTIPFVSKAIGRPLAKLATKLMVGHTLSELEFTEEITPTYYSVKEAVFPFIKFPGVDSLLGPEMKSTGEVMGIGEDFGGAFARAQIAAGNHMPLKGRVFISVKNTDKDETARIAQEIIDAGFTLIATTGTKTFLEERGVESEHVFKVTEGRPNIVDRIKSDEIDMLINTSFGAQSIADSYSLRRASLEHGVPYFTTVAGARAAIRGIRTIIKGGLTVKSLQDYHHDLKGHEK
ncbi:MAG: carbamoyl-phosphate synthase large subunit, partial [Thermodesulfobacteriota bacterium]